MLSHTSRSSRHAFLISAATFLFVGGLGRTAAAKTCTTDTDCSTGYKCLTQGGYAPTGGATSVGSGTATGRVDVGTGGTGGSVGSGGVLVVGSSCPEGSTCSAGTGGTIDVGTGGTPRSSASAGGSVGSSCPQGSKCVEVALPPTQSPSDSGPLPPAPEPMPVTGTCEIPCATVADCPSVDFDCALNMMPTIAPTCPANTTCPDPSLPSSTTGICVAKMHACSTAADCSAPLTCEAQYTTCSGGGSVSPDGTVTMMPETCTPGPSVCSWNPATCTTNSDCADPLYQCVKMSESTACSASGGACAPGVTCPPPPPPTCETVVTSYCLPKLVDCACGPCPAGSTCGPCQTCLPGWSCFDFAAVGGVPSAWGSVASNMACLPDGIVMAAQGHAAVKGEIGGSSSSMSGVAPTLDIGGSGGASGGTGVPTTTGTDTRQTNNTNPPSVSPAPSDKAPAEAAGSAQPATHSSGCAYGGSDASSLWLALGMLGLVARLARRRREDR